MKGDNCVCRKSHVYQTRVPSSCKSMAEHRKLKVEHPLFDNIGLFKRQLYLSPESCVSDSSPSQLQKVKFQHTKKYKIHRKNTKSRTLTTSQHRVLSNSNCICYRSLVCQTLHHLGCKKSVPKNIKSQREQYHHDQVAE